MINTIVDGIYEKLRTKCDKIIDVDISYSIELQEYRLNIVGFNTNRRELYTIAHYLNEREFIDRHLQSLRDKTEVERTIKRKLDFAFKGFRLKRTLDITSLYDKNY